MLRMLMLLAVACAAPAHAQVQREPRGVQPKRLIVQPVVIKSVQPVYTAEALRAKIAGEVHVTAFVRPDGTVAGGKIVKSLDTTYGLDRQALAAAMETAFQPGTVDGKPAPFAVTLVLEFSIRDSTAVTPVGVTSVRVVGEAPRAVAPSLSVAGNTKPEVTEETFVHRPGPGVTLPELVRVVPPKYPVQALAARMEGEVRLEAVVDPDGRARSFRVLRSLGPDLDAAATAAARLWRFKPGTVNSGPVRVAVPLSIEFRLQGTTGTILVEQTLEQFAEGAYLDTTPGLTKPEPISTPAPKYTSAAMNAAVEGDVVVDFVVLADGTVGRARIAKSLNPAYGLDDEALATIRQWRFRPAELNGQPVPVVSTATVPFRLR
jgi:TonB family protein